MTRRLGAQLSTGLTAAILFALTLLLTLALLRYRKVQVIPDAPGGMHRYTMRQSKAGLKRVQTNDWRPVIVGNRQGQADEPLGAGPPEPLDGDQAAGSVAFRVIRGVSSGL
jgi:hypothetical protein